MEEVGVGHVSVDVAQRQPLTGEVVDERASRATVGEHPPDLRVEHLGVAQAATRRQIEQLLVGDAAPEKEREARRQLEIAQLERGTSGDAGRIALGAEEEFRIDEDPFQTQLDARLEAAGLVTLLVELAERLKVGRGQGTPVRQTRNRGKNPVRAGGLVRARRRPAGEDLPPARRIARALTAIRTADLHVVDRRLPLLLFVDGERVTNLSRLQHTFQRRLRFAEEGDADDTRAGPDRKPYLEGLVGLMQVVLPLGSAEDRAREARGRRFAFVLAADGERLDAEAVEPDLELMRPAEAANVVVQVGLQLQPSPGNPRAHCDHNRLSLCPPGKF